MCSIVNEVEHEVILHCDIKSLHLLGSVTASGDGTCNSVLALHECVVFGLDFVNNIWGVNGVTVLIPVNSLW